MKNNSTDLRFMYLRSYFWTDKLTAKFYKFV